MSARIATIPGHDDHSVTIHFVASIDLNAAFAALALDVGVVPDPLP